MSFVNTISQYISRHDLLRRDGFYVVALSGGADSVALLLALKALGYRIEAAHCNFQLRGDESRRDEDFCVRLCEEQGIALHRVHFDTRTYAALHHESIETAARNLRYRYFEQLRRVIGADDICVAHHRDDQVETVLLHLLRGTGMRGLQGMQPRNGHIVRPMLGVSRQEIELFLEERKQPFVTDSTNLEDDAARNKLRLHVIPMLRQINAAAPDNIARAAENIRETSLLLDYALSEGVRAVTNADGSLSLTRLKKQPAPRTLLWQIVGSKGFRRAQMEEMLWADRNGAQWLSASHIAIYSQGQLHLLDLEQWQQPLPTLRIPEEGTYVYRIGTEERRISIVRKAIGSHYEMDRTPQVAQFDAARVAFPLTLRPVEEGDRFVPLGMTASKLVSDFLTNLKVPFTERHQQLALCNADGEIIWLVGRRISQTAAMRPESKEIVVASIAARE